MAQSQHIHDIIARLKGFKKAEKGVKGLSSSMKKFAAGLVSVTAAYKAFSVGLESIQLAGKLEGVETAFNSMRKEAGFSINTFSKLDKALDGTADKFTIMQQANQAMLLGIADSDDQMADLFDMAQRLAEAVGKDATFGIESFVTGIGRQSREMLDNLGLMVSAEEANKRYADALNISASALTDQQRKQAFTNLAIEKATNLVSTFGEETDTSERKMQRFSTSVTNLKLALGEALIESGVLDQLDRFTEWIDKNIVKEAAMTERQKELNAELSVFKQRQEELRTLRKELNILSEDEERSKLSSLEATLMERRVNEEIIKQGGTAKNLRGAINIELAAMGVNIQRTNAELDIESEKLETNKTSMVSNTEAMQEYVRVYTETPIIATMSQFSMLLTEQDANALNLQDRIKNLIEIFKELNDQQESNNDITKSAISVGMSAAAGHKTMAEATVDGAKRETSALLQTAIANIIKDNAKFFGFLGPAAPIAIAGVSAAAATMFEQQLSRINIGSQTGFEGVVDEPTQFTVGEGGAAEYVSVTPMEGVNNAGGGAGININITGNVMSEQFVSEELAEKISEAVRRGVNFGMS